MPETEFCSCDPQHSRIYFNENLELAKLNPHCFECMKPIKRNELTEGELKLACEILQDLKERQPKETIFYSKMFPDLKFNQKQQRSES